MKIHRSNSQSPPYQIMFEQDPETGFREQIVAKNALMLSPFDIECLQLTDPELGEWEALGFMLSRHENGEPRTTQVRFEKSRLKKFGGFLEYYARVTDEEVHRISCNNPPSKDALAARRVEGRMARGMYDTISTRVSVPLLWVPTRRQFPVGFTSSN